jgi:hypothetical protein
MKRDEMIQNALPKARRISPSLSTQFSDANEIGRQFREIRHWPFLLRGGLWGENAQ